MISESEETMKIKVDGKEVDVKPKNILTYFCADAPIVKLPHEIGFEETRLFLFQNGYQEFAVVLSNNDDIGQLLEAVVAETAIFDYAIEDCNDENEVDLTFIGSNYYLNSEISFREVKDEQSLAFWTAYAQAVGNGFNNLER